MEGKSLDIYFEIQLISREHNILDDKDSANRAEYKIIFFIFIPEVQPIFEISVSNLQKIGKSGAKK